MRLHFPTDDRPERGGVSLITIAILVLHLLVPAHAGSLKGAQDDINVFRKDKGTVFYCPRCKYAETKVPRGVEH